MGNNPLNINTLDYQAMSAIKDGLITSVVRVQMCFDGEPDEEDCGDLFLVTANDVSLRLYLQGDGITIGARNQSLQVPEEFDYGECHEVTFDVRELEDNGVFVGQRIAQIWLLTRDTQDEACPHLTGVKLHFDNDHFLVFYNHEDEAHLMVDQEPSGFIQDVAASWHALE